MTLVTGYRSHPLLSFVLYAFLHGWTLHVPHCFFHILIGLTRATKYFPRGL